MERSKKSAFSLAELMITLLILSIVLSAVMPAVTKRNAGQESVWRWLYDGSHAYFGTGSKQEALIGMAVKPQMAHNSSDHTPESSETIISDYGVLRKNPSNFNAPLQQVPSGETDKFTLTDIGDRLLIMKYTVTSDGYVWHPMSNSHISLFTTTVGDSGGNETAHYAGRIAMDETNIAIGRYTMAGIQPISSGDSPQLKRNNLALGQMSLYGLTTGYNNLAVGNETLYSDGVGYRNVAVGFQSAFYNESGYENNALGYQALFHNRTGHGNNAVGHHAGFGLTGGFDNTAIGSFALKKGPNDTYDNDGNLITINPAGNNGYYNTAVGYGSLLYGVESSYNTAIGILSGAWTSTGTHNIFAGAWTGFRNSTGSNNIMLGSYAGYGNEDPANNYATASNNIFIGTQSGYSNLTGENAIFIGTQSGFYNVSGYNNTFIGLQSGFSNSAGGNNVFIGPRSGYMNASSNNNMFIGYEAGYSNAGGTQNTFLGYQAGYNNTSGSHNVYIGYLAGKDNDAAAERQFSLASAGFELMRGQFPEAIGDSESKLDILAAVTNIGKDASQPVFKIDNSSNDPATIAINGNLVGPPPSGNLSIGSSIVMNNPDNKNISGVGTLYVNYVDAQTVKANTYIGLPAQPSDKRLKNVLGDATKGLSVVDDLKLVKYNYKNDETKTEHVGVIAQDLQKILPNAVIKMPDGFLAVSLNDIMFTIAKAVQELHQAVLDLAKEVKTLAAKVMTNSQKIEALEKENASLKKQINDLDARLKKLEEAK